MAAMVPDSFVVAVVVVTVIVVAAAVVAVVVVAVVAVRARPRAIPQAMLTMRKSTHGFPFVSHMSKGLRLAALGAAGAPLLIRIL